MFLHVFNSWLVILICSVLGVRAWFKNDVGSAIVNWGLVAYFSIIMLTTVHKAFGA